MESPQPPPHPRQGRLAPLLETLLCAVILLPGVFYPLARDQGVFAYAGQVVLDGGVPYRDVYEQKGPATHYTFAMILALLGETPAAVRAFFFLVALLGTQLAAALGSRISGPAARLPCAVTYAVVAMPCGPTSHWSTAQVEDLILPLGLASMLLIASPRAGQDRTTYRRLFFASLLLGLACTYKPTAIAGSLAVAAASLWWWRAHDTMRWAATSRRLLICASGFLLPAAGFGLFLWNQDAFDDFWMFVVEHNMGVYAKLKTGSIGQGLEAYRSLWRGLSLMALFGLAWPRRRATLHDALLLAFAAGSLAAVFWQAKYVYVYHWTPFGGALAVLAGLGVAGISISLKRTVARQRVHGMITAGLLSVTALLALPGPTAALNTWKRLGQLAMGQMSLAQFQSPYRTGAGTADDNRRAADYLRRHTDADDMVLVWGFDPVLNFLADRRHPSRFPLCRTICRPSPRRVQWQREFLAAVRRRPPAYIVVADDRHLVWYEPRPWEDLKSFEEFHEFIRQRYRQESRQGPFTLYRYVKRRQPFPGKMSGGPPE